MKAQHLVSEGHQLQGELGKDNTVSKQRCFLRMFLRIVCSGPPDSLWWVFVVVPLLFFPVVIWSPHQLLVSTASCSKLLYRLTRAHLREEQRRLPFFFFF